MGRAPCCDKNGLKKGPWTPEEDHMLITYIQTHGAGNWRTLPKNAGLQRCGKSCRLRWTNYLRPDIKRGRFSFEEEETIIQLHSLLGNKWSAIAARLPGRTDNEIKNYWNTHVRKRLLRNGIDPVTHAPRLDLLDLSSILSSALCSQSFLNLSSLLGNQALLNPGILRLATAISSLKQEDPELLWQQIQENQHCSSMLENQIPMSQPNQSHNLGHEISACSTPISQFLNQTQLMQANVEMFPGNATNFTCQDPLETNMPSTLNNNLTSQANLVFCNTDPTVYELKESSNLHSAPSSGYQNLGIDSVLSTPLSSPAQLHSSSTLVNSGGSSEDERESYCSSLLKFENIGNLNLEDLM
ncbi:hypothetical protein K2173_001722 [Erythroxylum novogranatense]|uniref:Uncharacterized protein n=1 Tax=Erythroxylum novogranatense TaxID=1862640 RepID=A0AAV8S811_9ROSI|nr:hypothetical protein K2173_001722 [Erythroxylum novogranatense]